MRLVRVQDYGLIEVLGPGDYPYAIFVAHMGPCG